MRLPTPILSLPLILLAACGQANGTTVDVTSDLHCSVLAFYVNGFAEHVGAPADQRRAAAAIHQWYAVKLRALEAQRGESATIMEEAAPILEAVKRDWRATMEQHMACATRATHDPGFENFVRNFG